MKVFGMRMNSLGSGKSGIKILQDVVQKNAIGEVRESQLSWSLRECAEPLQKMSRHEEIHGVVLNNGFIVVHDDVDVKGIL
jgi:hypothetical protein